MNAIANMTNWHRYVLGAIGIVAAILTAIVAQPSIVPPELHVIVTYAPFVLLILGGVTAGLPRFQLPTGPGAPAILSPPPKDTPVPNPTGALPDGHTIPPRG